MKNKLSQKAKGIIFLYGYLFIIFAIGFVCGSVATNLYKQQPTEAQGVEAVQVVEETPAPEQVQYKEFTVVATAYCPCYECSEGWGNKTSTGAKATAGRTIAVDPSVIPYGTEVIINGHTYIAEDCGGAIKGNKIDIYFDTHAETEQFGRRTLTAQIAA